MKDIIKLIILSAEDYADEFGTDNLLDNLFPGMTIGELVAEMYEYGMLPDDVIERLVQDV